MTARLALINRLISALPLTRLYKAKALLYRYAGLEIHPSARIVSSARFWGEGRISVGADTFIGHDVLVLAGQAAVSIGSCVDIGPRVTIVNGTHEIDMENLHSAGRGYSLDIVIGDGVWIGAGSTIIAGCRIGAKSIIAAGSVVTADIPAEVISVGVPCRPVKIWDGEAKQWIRV